MAAMLDESNNERYLHTNKIYERKIIVLFYSSNMAAVNILYVQQFLEFFQNGACVGN